ncbi:MAG: alpha/beta fold hydrolase [Verrucomicrobia bacterium]|nr:alpha/beta fold hydrolase [Verrucomicrobiota bacterium]
MFDELAHIGHRRIRFRLEGSRQKPILLLSHPLGVNLEIWNLQTTILKQQFRILRYDLPGHGGSSCYGDTITLTDLAYDVAILLDHLGIEKVAFIGLSVGGMIGQEFAIAYPDKLTRAIFCSTSSQLDAQAKAAFNARIEAVQEKGMTTQVEPVLKRWFTPEFSAMSPRTLEWVSDLILSTSVEGFIACCRAIQNLDTTDRLPLIEIPTLIMPGEKDQGFPPIVSEFMRSRIQGAELVVLSGAAHLGNVEQNHAFNEIILRFLLKNS